MRSLRMLVITLGIAMCMQASGDSRHNGFDVDKASIPRREILSGGPPRDGIPSIDHPQFVGAVGASFMKPDTRLIGLTYEGQSRAYPISILNWHEVVNDRFGKQSIVVTFCPLCGTGMVFKAPGDLKFGVSGLLYNSDVLLYDRATESLWSQIMMKSVSGPRLGEKLQLLPASHTNWEDWLRRQPDTLVLLPPAGSGRDYQRDPYRGYDKSRDLIFPVTHRDRRYHPKEQVLGLVSAGQVKAWPFVELSKTGGPISDTVDGRSVTVSFNSRARTATVRLDSGEELPAVIAYWFAWVAFHPETEVYKAP